MKIRHAAALIPAAAAAAVIALGGAVALAASPSGHAYRAGSCRAEGEFADCGAGGTATRPSLIYVHVRARPRQKVDVDWSMGCGKGNGAGGSSGQFSARTPIRRLLRHPYAKPDSCDVAAAGALADGGRVHVWISYRRWAKTPSPGPTPGPTPTGTPTPQPSCHPVTSGGNCYEPGEFCPAADHGVTGVAGDGETIKCEDNNGWRWEPV